MKDKPQANTSLAQKELDKAEKQFQAFDDNVKAMTMDAMNSAPKSEAEPVHNISKQEIRDSKDIYLKPLRSISSREKFNESYRKQYEEDMEYVRFIAENREIIGEAIDIWTKPYAGMPAQEWKVPVGKPVWGPKHLAKQIKRAKYHKLIMQQNTVTNSDGMGQYYGAMAVEETVQRLDARPADKDFSLFMGASNF